MKKTVRDQVYTLEMYLKYVCDGDICENADVQRLAGSFDTREMNELIYTALSADHIPELILAECNEDNHTYIADGLQRTTMLKLFKYGSYKVTSSLDHPLIEYMRKKRDADGHVVRNERGQIEVEEATFDIRNKTYDMLPEELKKEFNDFQIRVVIHEDCTMKRISDLIKRYNYQRPMTVSQKAFTYLDNFAVKAREISNKKFFVECEGYHERERMNGTIERVIAESVMCLFHLDNWKKSSKSLCEYLNQYASEREFAIFEEIVERLGNIVTPDFATLFTGKNSFVWFRIFYKFMEYGLDDAQFISFLRKFNTDLKDEAVLSVTYKNWKDITYARLDKESGTKDKVLIVAKINLLEALMEKYFNKGKIKENISTEDFIAQNLHMDIKSLQEDMDFYNESLDDLIERTVKIGSKLLEKENRPSLLAMMVYSYRNEVNLEDWLLAYAKRNPVYLADQKENFLHMRTDFEQYVKDR